MRIKLTYFLGASGILSLASSLVVVVLMANFMTSSVRDDRDKAYAAADTVMNGGINSIKTDLARMRMYTQQTVALIAPQFWHAATSQQALDAWNQTLFNQWAPRLVIPGETYGFAASFLFPSGVAGTYSVQSIQAYTDQLRGGVTQSTFTWTDPATGVNTFAAFAYNNATGPLVDFSTAYQYQITISYLVSLFGKTDLYDYPYAWAAADGNPYWYLTHCTDVGNSNGVHLVTQTFQSSTGWASLMSTALRSNVAEDLYVLGTDGTVVTSTNKQVQAFITACSGNDTAFDDVTVACAGLPFTSFPHLGAPAAVVRRWMNNSITSATTEVVDDAGTNKIVRMKPLFDRDNLHLVMVYVGDRPIPDNSTLIAFSVMMTMTILTVLVNFVGVAALLHPIRRAAHDMKRLSELDFSGFRGDGERSSIAETDDVLQSSNTLVVAMESFTRYMSVDLVRHLLGENEIAAVGTRVKPIVVLFADIVGFTELCSALSVDEVMTHLLARFFDVCTNAVLSTGGTVDKFIGDCVMAFWGAPGPHAHASTAALCSAMEIFEGLLHPESDFARRRANVSPQHRKIRLLGRGTSSDSVSQVSTPLESARSSAYSAQAGFNGVVKSRVGINAGDAHVGNVGCEQRISYTALGDCVNASSRMEALNKQVSRGGCGILASDAVLERAHPAIVRRFVGPTLLLGKSSVVDVYSVLGIDESSVPPGPAPGDVVVDKATRGAVAAADETQYLRSVMHHFPHLVQSFEQCEQSKRFSAAVAKIVDGYATEDVSDALRTATALSTDQPKTQLLDDLAKHGRIEQYSK